MSGERDGAPERRAGDYRQARVGAASALVAVTVVLLVLDVLVPDYDVDPVVLGLVLGAVVGLLGAEGIDALAKRGMK